MNSKRLKNRIFSMGIGALALTTVAGIAGAQNVNREYRQWQQAQVEAQRRCSRVRDRRDIHSRQEAQARAQREYSDYVQSTNRGNRYYGNNGYYNNNG